MFAVIDVAKAEARIEQYCAVRGLGSHAAEIMAAIKASSELAPREVELRDAFARIAERNVNDARRQVEADDKSRRVAGVEREREQVHALRDSIVNAGLVMQEFRAFLAQRLPCSDEARAFFAKLDETLPKI